MTFTTQLDQEDPARPCLDARVPGAAPTAGRSPSGPSPSGRAPAAAAQPGRGLGYVAALDGVRALAVAAVMAYHAGLPHAGGGFLGVDVFFVLSGFLITSLLVGEERGRGRVDLARFWSRRARRLLPALLLMLLAVAAYAALLAPPDGLGAIRRGGMATLLYVANWAQAYGGQGYFAQLAAPTPLLHTWSLAIEEQFYIAWPILVLVLLRAGRRLSRRPGRDLLPLLVTTLAGAAASAGAMAVLFRAGAGTNRVYYGTDTRAQDLLVGAALAVVVEWRAHRHVTLGADLGITPGRAGSRRAGPAGWRWALVVTALSGLVGVVWSVVTASGSSGWLYRGGFLGVALATAALLAGVTLAPGSVPARLFSLPPVRYVGRISYGLYLWHWPVYVALSHSRTGLGVWPLLGVRLAVTASLSVASYHLLEMPVRRRAGGRRQWVGVPAAAGLTAAALLGATVAPTGALADRVTAAPPAGPGLRLAAATESLLPAVPPGSPGPTRVLLVGDSMATSLALASPPAPEGGAVQLAADAVIGCGLVVDGLVSNRGITAPETGGLRGRHWVQCAPWPRRWANDVARFHPDVAVLLVGPWEVRDRLLHGHWVHLGQAAFDTVEEGALRRAVRTLSASGARVVLLTSPYFSQPEQADGTPQPADAPGRVDRFNTLLRRAAARFGARATVVDLGRFLSPGGRYSAVIDGQVVREGDGLHLSAAGGTLVWRWLLPQLRHLAGEARPPAPAAGT